MDERGARDWQLGRVSDGGKAPRKQVSAGRSPSSKRWGGKHGARLFAPLGPRSESPEIYFRVVANSVKN